MSKPFEFEPGFAEPIRVLLRAADAARTPVDTTGMSLRLRVPGEGDLCTFVPSIRDPETGEFVIDTNAVTLAARSQPYTAIIDVDWGQGWRRHGQIALRIMEAC